jgi:hypothetical protein
MSVVFPALLPNSMYLAFSRAKSTWSLATGAELFGDAPHLDSKHFRPCWGDRVLSPQHKFVISVNRPV